MKQDYLQKSGLPSPLASQVEQLLRSRRILSAADLIAATGKSQQLVSLALKSLGGAVCKIGAARRTRYSLTRPILGLSAKQPLLHTDESGNTRVWGEITQLRSEEIYVRKSDGGDWLTPPNALPWFLAPLKPEGFLARAMRAARPDFVNDPSAWTIEQALFLAITHHSDPPGAFAVGDHIGRIRTLAASGYDDRRSHYDSMAEMVGKTLPAQSSAGGEQPKFVTEYSVASGELAHFVVKFSPPRGTPFGERWRGLLHLEHLANQVLREAGLAVATTNIIESNSRTYLESERFDRIGARGKRHVVALDAIDRQFNEGRRENWVKSCDELCARGLLTIADVAMVAKLYAFGQFIGNTDMHFGNLSFHVDDVVKPGIRLAPVYDMLPMMWRPAMQTGELDATPVREQPRAAGHDAAYDEARQWAVSFWQRASGLDALTSDLRESAARGAERVSLGFNA